MKLYNYFRSSASFRVRIALNLKGLDFDYIPVHIARGDHKTGPFAAISPEFQQQVNTAYHAYQKAFDAAVEQAHSDTNAPTPDNVKLFADRLLLILSSIPVAP